MSRRQRSVFSNNIFKTILKLSESLCLKVEDEHQKFILEVILRSEDLFLAVLIEEIERLAVASMFRRPIPPSYFDYTMSLKKYLTLMPYRLKRKLIMKFFNFFNHFPNLTIATAHILHSQESMIRFRNKIKAFFIENRLEVLL